MSARSKPVAGSTDDTGEQLEQLLAGLTPMGGYEAAGSMPDYIEGRRLVEKMADKAWRAGDDDVDLPLTIEQCAQVIGFLSLADNKWMTDAHSSHAVGFTKLMNVLKNNLRTQEDDDAVEDESETPKAAEHDQVTAAAVLDTLPARHILKGRIDDQREFIWRARGVIGAAQAALQNMDNGDNSDADCALHVACELLEQVATAMDPDNILAPTAVERRELAQEAQS